MIVKKNNLLLSEAKKPIIYDVYFEPSSGPKPVVIFAHGYKGFKDWGAWELVAETFAKAGFFFIKFNFSHNGGTIEQPIDFPDLEAFATNNYSIELDDLNRIVDFITSNNSFFKEINSEKINLIGHSRGGGIVLIHAEEDHRVGSVTTWAGVSDFKARFNKGTRVFDNWLKSGVTYIENSRTKQQLPHYLQFYKDFEKNEERLTIKRAVSHLSKPQLIIHGSDDTTVPIDEAIAVSTWNSESNLEIINGADHVFGSIHPWKEKNIPPNLQQAASYTITFLNNL
ncbi:MAG: pimeloyl-ACP methyl ester carboxylesterase [Sediminicola sp.]|jgi:pimeloyl-ACP methyl ester carboxylesterase